MKPISPFVVKMSAIGLLLATLLVSVGLAKLGLPVPTAIAVGLLIVGIAVTALERRLEREAPVFGITMLFLAGLAAIAAAVHAIPQINGKVVGFSTFALEILALYGLYKLYQRLSTKAGSVLRRRLAQRHGWRFEPTATVSIPGPRTAHRLAGVPDGAATTTGRDAVFAAASGLDVIVFDRVRPNERNAKPQTVWLVRLPLRLPYVLSSYARYLTAQERATGTASAASAAAVSAANAAAVSAANAASADNAPLSTLRSLLDPSGTSASGLGATVDRALDLPPLVAGQPGDHTDDPAFAAALMTPEVRGVLGVAGFPALWWIENDYLCTVRTDEGRAGTKPALVEEYVDRLAALATAMPWPALTAYARADRVEQA